MSLPLLVAGRQSGRVRGRRGNRQRGSLAKRFPASRAGGTAVSGVKVTQETFRLRAQSAILSTPGFAREHKCRQRFLQCCQRWPPSPRPSSLMVEPVAWPQWRLAGPWWHGRRAVGSDVPATRQRWLGRYARVVGPLAACRTWFNRPGKVVVAARAAGKMCPGPPAAASSRRLLGARPGLPPGQVLCAGTPPPFFRGSWPVSVPRPADAAALSCRPGRPGSIPTRLSPAPAVGIAGTPAPT